MHHRLHLQLFNYLMKIAHNENKTISELMQEQEGSTVPSQYSEDDLRFYEDMLKLVKSPYKAPQIPELFPGEIEEDAAPPTRKEAI